MSAGLSGEDMMIGSCAEIIEPVSKDGKKMVMGVRKAGETCDPNAAINTFTGCIEQHRCADAKLEHGVDAGQPNLCVPIGECYLMKVDTEGPLRDVEVTWMCNASRLVAATSAIIGLYYAL